MLSAIQTIVPYIQRRVMNTESSQRMMSTVKKTVRQMPQNERKKNIFETDMKFMLIMYILRGFK